MDDARCSGGSANRPIAIAFLSFALTQPSLFQMVHTTMQAAAVCFHAHHIHAHSFGRLQIVKCLHASTWTWTWKNNKRRTKATATTRKSPNKEEKERKKENNNDVHQPNNRPTTNHDDDDDGDELKEGRKHFVWPVAKYHLTFVGITNLCEVYLLRYIL